MLKKLWLSQKGNRMGPELGKRFWEGQGAVFQVVNSNLSCCAQVVSKEKGPLSLSGILLMGRKIPLISHDFPYS